MLFHDVLNSKYHTAFSLPPSLPPFLFLSSTPNISGILGEPGSSAFIFDQKAIIELSIDASNSSYTEDPMELAIEVGAEDVEVQNDAEGGETEGRLIQLECGSSELSAVCAAVRERGLEVTSASVVYLPRSSVSLTPEQFEKAEKLVEMLSDQSDVVTVYSNHELA